MEEVEQMKQELGKLKIDMSRVLKEKRHAERAFKAYNSKAATLSASLELIKKEMKELNEEQALVYLARIEAVKECESIQARRKEDANRHKTRLLEAKKNMENEQTTDLQIKLSDINLLEMEAKEGMQEGSLLNTITVELEAAKEELASIKGEGFNFMASMDVHRDELKQVREEKARLQKAEQKQDLTVQNLNAKILGAKAKLEALTSSEAKSNTVASNLSISLELLRAKSEKAKKETDVINEEIESTKGEIHKTESEIQLAEERLETAIEELKTVKSSESKALGNLKNVIKTTVEARYMASMNSSTITITNFEYEYLTRKAGGATDLADLKISAAQSWVEALKTNEREILMKIEATQRKINELRVETDEDEDEDEDEDQLTESTVADSSLLHFPPPVHQEVSLYWEHEELVSLFYKEQEQQNQTPPCTFSFGKTDPSVFLARKEAVDWILKVKAHYGFTNLTAILAINYLDRFLSSLHFQKDKPWMIQLVAVSCLSLAAKVEETRVPLLLDLQVQETKFLFEAKNIQKMELLVMSTLKWRMNPVTPISFLDHIVRRLGLSNHVHRDFYKKCEALILCLICDSRFACYKPSVLATATMLHVLDEIDPPNNIDYKSQLLDLLKITKEDIDDCHKLIIELSYNNPNKDETMSYLDSQSSSDSWEFTNDRFLQPLFKKTRFIDEEFRFGSLISFEPFVSP